MRSTPDSVSFWTTHSGRSPFTGTKPTVTSGSGRADAHDGPVGLENRSVQGAPRRRRR